MKRLIALAALTTLVASGCAGTVGVLPSPGPTKPGASVRPGDPVVIGPDGSVLPQKVRDIVGMPVEPLAGVEFKTISQQDAKNLGGGMVAAGAGNVMAKAAPAAAPMAGAAMADNGGAMIAEGGARGSSGGDDGGGSAGGGAYSGNSDSYYGYGYWFGGSDQMSLVSMTLGETEGSPTFLELTKKVGPVVKAWDPTARLLSTSADLGTDGKLYKPTPAPTPKSGEESPDLPACGAQTPQEQFWDGQAWRLVYRSAKRNEVLQIAGKADKTVIVRMRWAPLDLDLEEVQVDAGAAITKVAAAIQDKAAMAEEEKTKLDYFLGIPFEQRTGMEWQDRRRSKLEVLYTVPKGVQWNASLDRVLGKLVWNLSFYGGYDNDIQEKAREEALAAFKAKGFAAFGLTDPDDPNAPTPPAPSGCSPWGGRYYPYYDGYGPYGKPTPLPSPSPGWEIYQPDPNVWVNMSSQAMVDARTGTLIRFSRPTKTINIQPKQLRPIPNFSTPSPSPTAVPSPQPIEPGIGGDEVAETEE